MKISDQTILEFQTLSDHFKLLEQSQRALQSGFNQETVDGVIHVLNQIENAQKSFSDPNLKEAASMVARVVRIQLELTTDQAISEAEHKKKLTEFQKANANLQNKLLAITSAIQAHQNPTLANKFASWFAEFTDKFRV